MSYTEQYKQPHKKGYIYFKHLDIHFCFLNFLSLLLVSGCKYMALNCLCFMPLNAIMLSCMEIITSLWQTKENNCTVTKRWQIWTSTPSFHPKSSFFFVFRWPPAWTHIFFPWKVEVIFIAICFWWDCMSLSCSCVTVVLSDTLNLHPSATELIFPALFVFFRFLIWNPEELYYLRLHKGTVNNTLFYYLFEPQSQLILLQAERKENSE